MVQAAEIMGPFLFNEEQTASISPSDLCYNYSLTGENECEPTNGEAPPFTFGTLFLEIGSWNPMQIEESIISEENEAGEKRIKLSRQSQIISCTVIVNNFLLNVLYGYKQYDKWDLSKKDGGSWEMKTFDVGAATPVGNLGYFTVTLTMTVADGDTVKDGCCGSAFAGATYEDCTTEDGTPEEPIECDEYALDPLVFDLANKTLTATTTGKPEGANETFRWYYSPNDNSPVTILTDTAAVITVTSPGIYTAIATAGQCETDEQSFLYAEDCDAYDAIIALEDGFILVEPNRISEIDWEFDDGTGFSPLGESGLIHKPAASGDYRATVTSGECEIELNISIDLGDCDFSTDILVNGDILTAEITGYTGNDTPVYAWYLDTGAGPELLVGEVSDTLIVDEPGNYILEVTLDTCTKVTNQVLLGDCYAFSPYIDYVIPSGGDVQIMAGHENAPGPVDIEWYQIRNGVWTNVGTGISVVIDEEGPTKMVATSGDCIRERFTQACVDPSMPEWEERIVTIAAQTELIYTQIDLPNPTGLSEEDIGAEYELYRNGARLVYKHEANMTHRSEWSINAAGNAILNWPARDGEVYVLVRRYIP